MPLFLLGKYRPRLIGDFIRKDQLVGRLVGINLKAIDLNQEEAFLKYLDAIKSLDMGDFDRLYCEGLDPNIQLKLEEAFLVEPNDGVHILIKNIKPLIKDIHRQLKEGLEKKELLIITRKKELAKKTIKEVSKDLKLITLIGCREDEEEEIYQEIYEETGLSIFFSKDIRKLIGNYNIIINFEEEAIIDFSKLKRNVILFDFSPCRRSRGEIKAAVIEDIGFDLTDLGFQDNPFIENRIKSSLYELMMGREVRNYKYISTAKGLYLLKDYVNTHLKIKGHL